jgi:imidazolonepropionase-like amidohydrolase
VKARVLRTDGLKARNPRILEMARQNGARRLETMQKNLVRLHQAGVRVVLGTDAGNPLTLHGPSIFVELEAMQQAGLPAKDVLVAATRDAAEAMGRGADLGLIAAGRIADLLVLDADPEQDVKAFRSLSLVVRAGVLHERAALLPRGP